MQTLEQWRSFYDGWAGQDPALASTGRVLVPAEFARLAAAIAAWLDLSGRERVLDVGCASGTLTSAWSTAAREVVGVDFSQRLIADARARHARSGLSFLQAEAARLPFPDHSFDAVCCYNVLLSLPDAAYAERAVEEIVRVARPGARVLLGSLPDARKKSHFFDLLDRRSPWYRRAVPREVRWRLKRVLRPGSRPGETRILWFEPDELARRLRARGWSVDVRADLVFDDHHEYRSTLVLRRARQEVARR